MREVTFAGPFRSGAKIDVLIRPDSVSWLKERGLAEVEIVISDDQRGLVSALRREEVIWQRCQVHFLKSVVDAAPTRWRACGSPLDR